MWRRSSSLLQHLARHGVSPCCSPAEIGRLLPVVAAHGDQLAAVGLPQLTSCSDFRAGSTPGFGRGFSSSVLDNGEEEQSDAAEYAASAASGLDPQVIAEAASAAETDALAAAAEAAWLPTRGLMDGLSVVRDAADVPWWGSIVIATAIVRTFMFPAMVYQMRNTAKLSAARPEMEGLVKWLKEQQTAGNGQAAQQEYQARMFQIWKKHDANPMRSLVGIGIQAPAFLCFFAGLRHLAAAKVPSMMEGGALWFPDLTLADPTYALPVLCSLSFLLTVELGAADGMQGQPPEMLKRMKNIMRGISVAIIPFTASMPAGVFVYWITSNFFSLFQTAALKNSGLRSLLKLPPLGAIKAAVTPEAPLFFENRPPPSNKQHAAAGPLTYDVEPLPANDTNQRPQPKGRKAKGKRR